MDRNPKYSGGQDDRCAQHCLEIRPRSDAGEEQVERCVPEVGRTDLLQLAERSERKQQAACDHQQHRPRGMTDDGRIAQLREALSETPCHHGAREPQSNKQCHLPQVDGPAMGGQLRQMPVGFLDRLGSRICALVVPPLVRAEEQQHAHPAVSHHGVHNDDRPEHGIRCPDALGNGDHVGGSADPAPRKSGESHPHVFREPSAEHQQCYRPSDDDAERSGHDHEQRHRPQPYDAAEVHRHHQQQ